MWLSSAWLTWQGNGTASMCFQSSKLYLLLRKIIRKEWHLKRVQWVVRATASSLFIRLLQHFLNEAQDETQVGITGQAVTKQAYTCFKEYVLTNFKPFIDLLKWNLRLLGPKNGFLNFLDFLYLAWLFRY